MITNPPSRFGPVHKSVTSCWLSIAFIVFAPFGICAQQDFHSRVNQIMDGVSGAAIVSNPRTGTVLAVWNQKTAFDDAFPPGSTAKIVVSAMALDNDLISPTDKVNCRRIPVLLGEAYRCSHP